MARTYIPVVGGMRSVTNASGERTARGLQVAQGSFSKVSGVAYDGAWIARRWYYCREWFHDQSHGVRRILYTHKSGKTDNLAHFIRKVERRLKVEPKTEIGPTQRKTISWVRVSPWWTNSSMKRSFFTMMLRCGQNYDIDKEDFNDALYSIAYTRETEYAVKRFLAGYTLYAGYTKGWYQAFRWGNGFGYRSPNSEFTKELVKKLLVRPEQ